MDKGTILLASGSPRRAEILKTLGLPFLAVPPDLDEDLAGLSPQAMVLQLAEDKAAAMTARAGQKGIQWIMAADTLIDLDGLPAGKPGDRDEAGRMLKSLSGREHSVITGLCVIRLAPECVETEAVETRVRFGTLTENEIEWYLRTNEWVDAAGAYKIQGKGAVLVEGICGSYSNVVGLPIRPFYGILMRLNYPYPEGFQVRTYLPPVDVPVRLKEKEPPR